MADFNQLNKAKMSKFDVIFSKNQEISEAILQLVRTAYEDHHEEEKDRRKKLVECLFDRCQIIIDQLSDETLKNKIKEKITKLVQKDKGFTSTLKTQIENDLQETIEQASTTVETTGKSSTKIEKKQIELPSNNDLIDKVFSNKKFVSNITKFTKSLLETTNKNRLKILEKNFVYKSTFKNQKEKIKQNRKSQTKLIDKVTQPTKNITENINNKNNSIINQITNINKKLISSFVKNTLDKKGEKKPFKEFLSGKISEVIKFSKHIKYQSLRGIVKAKKMFNPLILLKGVRFLLVGTIKIFTRIVTGLFKGIFSLIKGIFKLGINIIKGTFKIVSGVVSSIYKVTKKITKGLAKLTVGFFSKIKKFFFSPVGAYWTGFIIGWISAKITKKYKEIKEKVIEIKDNVIDWFHQKRTALFDEMAKNPWVKRIHELLIVKQKFSNLQIYMIKATRFLRNFSFSKAVLGAAKGAIGGWVGGTIGAAVGSLFGGPLGSGIGAGLGYIAGDLIGQVFQGVPEKTDAQTQKERNLITSTITNKYKQKRNQKISNTKSLLKQNINQLDDKINKLSQIKEEDRTEEQKKQLEKLKSERKRHSDSLELLSGSGGKLIDDESEQERNQNDKYVQKLTNMLMEEQKQLKEWNFKKSIFSSGLMDKVKDYNVDEIFAKAGSKKVELTDINQFPLQVRGLDPNNVMRRQNNIRESLRLLSTLKVNCVQAALGAYERGQIPFSKIQETANKLLQQQLVRSTVNINENNKIPIGEYLTNHYAETTSIKGLYSNKTKGSLFSENVVNLTDGSDSISEFESTSFDDINDQLNSSTTLNDYQERLVEKLTNKYIENYERMTGSKLSDDKIEIIRKSFENFVLEKNLTRDSYVRNLQKKDPNVFDILNKTIAHAINVGLDDELKETEECDNVPMIDKLLVAFRNSLMADGVVPEELNKEFKKTSDENLAKLGVIEQKKKERNQSLEDAKTKNKEQRIKNQELQDTLIQLDGVKEAVPVPVERLGKGIPDYLRSNQNSGVKEKENSWNESFNEVGSSYGNYWSAYGKQQSGM